LRGVEKPGKTREFRSNPTPPFALISDREVCHAKGQIQPRHRA
jgi:hypothetical protein